MASLKARTARAAALHRQAAAIVAAVATAVEDARPAPADEREQRELADRLLAAGATLAPGWLGEPLSAQARYPVPEAGAPLRYVRIGAAHPLPEVRVPAIVPLIGAGHLTLDTDAREPRVGALLRSLLLRLLAAAPAGTLLVRAIAGTGTAPIFTGFAPLADAGLMAPPVVDRAGLLAVLAEAERWVRPGRRASHRQRRRDRCLLVVVAALPSDTEPADLARIAALTEVGVEAGLHLVVAGWPTTDLGPAEPGRPTTPGRQTRPGHPTTPGRSTEPAHRTMPAAAPDPSAAHPTTTAEPSTARWPVAPRSAVPRHDEDLLRRPTAKAAGSGPPGLVDATAVRIDDRYAYLGDPPGASFDGRGTTPGPGGLDAPVLLDPDPPIELVDRVCRDLAARFAVDRRPEIADLLPQDADELWTEEAADGLTAVVGHDADTPVTLRFTELTPHWLVSGRPGGGTSSFLANVVYGLAARYRPDALVIHLLDLRPSAAFREFLPTESDRSWLPHVRTAGIAADREYGVALLRELDAELDRRQAAFERAGAGRLADLPEPDRPPRVVCLVDGAPLLLVAGDRLAREAGRRLDSVARRGRSHGVHLILVGDAGTGAAGTGAGSVYPDTLLGQFPVRIALPGGGEVLEPANDSAADLPPGAVVVNTAGGLGGPRGATRGHERVVRFPDPQAAAPVLAGLRNRLWLARPAGGAPRIFAGSASARLDDDPAYRELLAAAEGPPVAMLGQCVDVSAGPATFPLDGSPNRHLAIVGRSATAAEVLEAAARSVAAAHPPGSARFAVASLVEEADPVADALVSALRDRHEVDIVDPAGLAKELDGDRPGYLVVFGMDAASPTDLPRDQFRAALAAGPARGVHLLSWWRRTRRLVELAGDRPLGEYVAGVLLLDLPAIEAEYLLGRDADWRSRPGRATLFDARTGVCELIVPYGRAGGER